MYAETTLGVCNYIKGVIEYVAFYYKKIFYINFILLNNYIILVIFSLRKNRYVICDLIMKPDVTTLAFDQIEKK